MGLHRCRSVVLGRDRRRLGRDHRTLRSWRRTGAGNDEDVRQTNDGALYRLPSRDKCRLFNHRRMEMGHLSECHESHVHLQGSNVFLYNPLGLRYPPSNRNVHGRQLGHLDGNKVSVTSGRHRRVGDVVGHFRAGSVFYCHRTSQSAILPFTDGCGVPSRSVALPLFVARLRLN